MNEKGNIAEIWLLSSRSGPNLTVRGGGGVRIKDTGPPRKWETDPPENLQICTEIHQCWKRSGILEVRKCRRKHYEDSEGHVHLGTVSDSSVAEMPFKQPCWWETSSCFSLILPEEAESDHRHRICDPTCKDLNWWETYRREQQGQHEQS